MEKLKVDICCGLTWGDEAKGKVVSQLAKSGKYDFVCRWSGSHNSGHTVYVDGKHYKTNLIPAGIFYNVLSIIGPDCIVNKKEFLKEIDYLKKNGFNTDLIKISSKCHVIQEQHVLEDNNFYVKTQGSTGKGVAPCARDKYARTGQRVNDDENIEFFKSYIWDEKLYGNILCEGAQGYWLDINYGNYPYVTSGTTLPYSSCSLGFSTHAIDKIYGASKMYDTRSGIDPLFPDSLLDNKELKYVGELGKEYGVTTGRRRKVNWLNLDKLCEAILITGTTDCIISKTDIIVKANIYKLYFNKKLHEFLNLNEMKQFINNHLKLCSPYLENIIYSGDVEVVNELNSTLTRSY